VRRRRLGASNAGSPGATTATAVVLTRSTLSMLPTAQPRDRPQRVVWTVAAWSARQSGSSFESDPASTSSASFAVMGREKNGVL
jgi:hypothetical protein